MIGDESLRIHTGAKAASDYTDQTKKRAVPESSRSGRKKTVSKRQKQSPPPPLSQSPAVAQNPAKDRKLAFDPSALVSDDEDDDFEMTSFTPAPTTAAKVVKPLAKDFSSSSVHRLSAAATLKLKNLLDLLSNESDLLADPSDVKSLYESIDEPLPAEADAAIKGIFSINSYKADFNAALDRISQRNKNKTAEEEVQAYIHDTNEQKAKLDAVDADLALEKTKVSDAIVRIKELEELLEKAKHIINICSLKPDSKAQRAIVRECGNKVVELQKKIPEVPGTAEEDLAFVNKVRDIIGNTYATIDKLCN